MKRKHILLLFLLIALLFTACSKKSSVENKAANDGTATQNTTETTAAGKATSEESSTTQRKIVITANYSIETTDFDVSVSKVKELTEQSGGYIENSEVSDGSATFVLRIPKEKAGDLDALLSPVGNILSNSQKRDDITDTYYDTKSSLDSLSVQYDRILAILGKATDLDDVLKLETELNRIRTQIETLTTEMKNYDNEVSYATVNIDLSSVAVLTSEKSFWENTLSTFNSSFAVAGDIVKGLWYAFIWIFPYLVFFGIVGLILIIIMFIRKKRKK